ncbi:anti-sigma factor antagonist [Actinokineospora spheciospongiae]|uniref:Anti-sigma factor antagonist n=1 Tax=Actinokineospora spheciospongiae TaxID=909613 RepID=W7J4F2_9PSEU|nr:STAS domain-containing protein [Actinokineospora spheciospongiae]EWC61019.1 anti-sigma factor antagonist [Actinokineospora spheciospongiae]PWW62550.1 anti-sigma B factor antagonist/stage II sporulation protein AA (anti-sigma F factor antagonist) [Actinokineospora spheciospongiae]
MNDFNHTVSTDPGRVVVTVEGELDMHTSVEFKQVLMDLVADDTDLLVDLSGLTFVDSSGLSAFIAVHKSTLNHERASLLLARVPPFLNRILAVTGLAAVLPIAGAQANS